MYNILSIGRSGLNAVQNKMDSISVDIANSNTYGYKRNELTFQELIANEIYDNEVIQAPGINGVISAGTKSGVSTVNFEQGALMDSTGNFHLAIGGEGFFGVTDESGNTLLTRNGLFHLNGDNTITDDKGCYLNLDLYVPIAQWDDADVVISHSGDILGTVDGNSQLVGRVILYRPEVMDSLINLGEGRYAIDGSVELYNSLEDDYNFGNIIQNALENSNVDLTKSLTEMIISQRAYSANTKAIQSTEDIMSMINDFKR